MFNMINLIKNENMKLVHRISTWIMIGILIAIVLLAGIAMKVSTTINTNDNWKSQLEQENKAYKEAMGQSIVPESAKDTYIQTIKINEYRIQHNIPPTTDGVWDFVNSCSGIISFISLFAIIIGGGIVANEFSSGAIKLLLIRPLKRWKILLSKYFIVLCYILFMLIILFAFSFLLGGILFSFSGASAPFLKYSGGKVIEENMILHSLAVYGLECVKLIMMVTLAFMISTVFRNSSLAIGIGIFLLFIGTLIAQLLARFTWSKYILFQNTDLSVYLKGNPPVKGMTMTFSVIVLIVYFAIFMVTSFLVFDKRDVAA